MVITGECYDTRIVAGSKLAEAYVAACYEPKEEAPADFVQQVEEDLANLDNWSQDVDAGPIYYKESVGEIGAIEFIRLFGWGIESVAPIAIERERQIDEERWTPQHDEAHVDGELIRAAVCYADCAKAQALRVSLDLPSVKKALAAEWPWEPKWFKPADNPLRNLTKAGALIAAEICRLQRKK